MDLEGITTYQVLNRHFTINRCLKRCITDCLDDDLNLMEWLTMGLIIDKGPKGVRNTTIGRSLRLDMPVVTKIINKLEQQKYVDVIEDPKDGRAQRVVVTDKGLKASYKIESTIREKAKDWLGEIDKEVLDNFFTVQEILNRKAQEQL